MIPTERANSPRVLLVDDDDGLREMMTMSLKNKGFEVVDASNVTDALRLIASEKFDALITDLHMPNVADGFTVISAMRHSQPEVLTLLVSGYPDVENAMSAILLEADEIIVKPFDVGKLADMLPEKVATRRPAARTEKERVAAILHRCADGIVADWLVRVRQNKELNRISLSDEECTGYLPQLIEDLVVRLRKSDAASRDSGAMSSTAAADHGKMRRAQGYTPAMLVHDSRILQVTIFGTLQNNYAFIDFSLLLPDVMMIADEVDSQLTQAMESYMEAEQKPAAA
jgi:YesN/AraC family two-component response regulator